MDEVFQQHPFSSGLPVRFINHVTDRVFFWRGTVFLMRKTKEEQVYKTKFIP